MKKIGLLALPLALMLLFSACNGGTQTDGGEASYESTDTSSAPKTEAKAETEAVTKTETKTGTEEGTKSETETEGKSESETKPNETEADNWYNDGFVVPDNWMAVMTNGEAFEHFDEIAGEAQDGKSIDEIVQNLMNRNVIAFAICNGSGYNIDYTADESQACLVQSDYFDSFEDITELMSKTYTGALAEDVLNGEDGERIKFFEEDNKLFVNPDKLFIWSSAPFENKTYIEIVDSNDSECNFIWHYIMWERWDYENNDTDEFYPHHYFMTFKAARENDEWRLESMIFDNPFLDMSES